MNYKKYLLILIILLSSCELSTEKLDTRYDVSIRSLFIANNEKTGVYLHKTIDLYDTSVKQAGASLFIEDAAITIEGSDLYYDNFNELDYSFSKSYVSSDIINFTEGKEYKINVETEFGQISGKTTIPGKVEIINPTEDYIIETTSDSESNSIRLIELDIEWKKANEAKIYCVEISIPTNRNLHGSGFYETSSYYTKDLFFHLNTSLDVDYFDASKDIILNIYAYDKNYYSHNFDYNQAAGVTGGYGFVGSASVSSIELKVKEWE